MIDFLIVGQGIAGSVLALQLLQKGQRVLVINNSARNQASSVAAGMYNPITGKALIKTWLADALFPYLKCFYRTMEQTLGTSFLHAIPIFRPFLSAEERKTWLSRATQAAYAPFIQAIADASYHQEHMRYHHGGLVLQQAGYLDVPHFLSATCAYLRAREVYLEEDFTHKAVHLTNSSVKYGEIIARRLIFCEGPQAQQNPFFDQLSLSPVKGEWLSVALDQSLEVIYNRGVFVLPRPNARAIVGATYHRKELTLNPTERARQDLEDKLKGTFRLSYRILNQQAGIRPATRDHRPLIGMHNQYPQVGIFNGLGTKGISLAPYFANAFVQHLLHGEPLPAEVIWSRR
ncbi:MAG: FAD-binding oxidoreductase [Bacteroidota bacterium]